MPDSIRHTRWKTGALIGVGTGFVGSLLLVTGYLSDNNSAGRVIGGVLAGTVMFGLVLGTIGGLIGSAFPDN
jgi:hypothetical protein